MPCGPQMVGRVLAGATHGRDVASVSASASGLGITSRRECLDAGPVAPSGEDQRHLRSLAAWIGWMLFALGAAAAIAAWL